MKKLMSYALIALLLSGCSFASYYRAEGEKSAWVCGAEFGTDRALEGLVYSSDKVNLAITGDQVTQTKGLEAAVRGAVSAALKTVVP